MQCLENCSQFRTSLCSSSRHVQLSSGPQFSPLNCLAHQSQSSDAFCESKSPTEIETISNNSIMNSLGEPYRHRTQSDGKDVTENELKFHNYHPHPHPHFHHQQQVPHCHHLQKVAHQSTLDVPNTISCPCSDSLPQLPTEVCHPTIAPTNQEINISLGQQCPLCIHPSTLCSSLLNVPDTEHYEEKNRHIRQASPCKATNEANDLPSSSTMGSSPMASSRSSRGARWFGQRIAGSIIEYLPFLIVSSISILAAVLLVSATVIYFQYFPIQEKYIQYEGNCDSSNCSQYTICVKDTKHGSEKCICQDDCGHDGPMVCATDGRTYINECQFRKYYCHSSSAHSVVSIAFLGSCDLCTSSNCMNTGKCANDPSCTCPSECPSTHDPVCASNGVFYGNQCLLRKENCEKGSNLSISFHGECIATSNPINASMPGAGYIRDCDPKTCRYGGTCEYDDNGVPSCSCSYSCPSETSEEEKVCGSDGRLYENECKLQEEACRRQQDIQTQDPKMCEESKKLPCNGHSLFMANSTSYDSQFHCDPRAGGHLQCPAGSYCHKTAYFAFCCPQPESMTSNCNRSEYGCCSDSATAAPGPKQTGCPEQCNCNKMGSYSATCNPISGQCQCKTGVGGLQCDRCEPGYWGLHKTSEGNSGCIPCFCNMNGSVRHDCEQMTGRCVCKHGLQGIKCNVCPEGSILGPDGCTHVALSTINKRPCSDQVRCGFGATCVDLSADQSKCICDIDCNTTLNASLQSNTINQHSISISDGSVCGVDGVSYPSECALRLFACRMQKFIQVQYKGSCGKPLPAGYDLSSTSSTSSVAPQSNLLENVTIGPMKRSTVLKTTLQDSDKALPSEAIGNDSELVPASVQSTVSTVDMISYSDSPHVNEKLITIPGFFGESSIEMPRLQAYNRLSVEIEFTALSDNGLLLYNGQTSSGEGDFVSLSIKGGFVEFRYNLGSGTVILRSQKKIHQATKTMVVAKRYLREGVLSVNSQKDITGKADGELKSLDLADKLYLGRVWSDHSKIYENIGTRKGFTGCISLLRISRVNINLAYPGSPDILRAVGLVDCADIPCSNTTSA